MTEGNVDYLQSTCSFEDESLLKELVTYKEYLPLWEGLLNINRHASDSSKNIYHLVSRDGDGHFGQNEILSLYFYE